MNKKIILAVLLAFPVIAFAQGVPDFSAFRFYKNVSPTITKTNVVEVPLNKDSFSIPSFAVHNLTTGDLEPNFLVVEHQETHANIAASGAVGDPAFINDGNYGTYLEFPATANSNRAGLFFTFEKPITASSLSFTLDNYVALPQTISVTTSGSSRSGEKVVLAPVQPTGTNIVFPQTTSTFWSVYFDYVQPLRISEIKFNDVSNTLSTNGLRFLAQPGQKYQVYFDADRYVQSASKESGDLHASHGVIFIPISESLANLAYKPADTDSDSIPDLSDNCVSIPNKDQIDADKNGRGDACEDDDRDGVINSTDNCIDTPNAAQTDTDADNIGDVCDPKDNRVTERLPWLPWAGIGIAGVVVLSLFVMVLRQKKEETIIN